MQALAASHSGGGFYELRGANAGRVIIKQTSSTDLKLLGGPRRMQG